MCTFENSSVALKAIAKPLTEILENHGPDEYRISFDAVKRQILVTYDAGHAEDMDVILRTNVLPRISGTMEAVQKFSLHCREQNQSVIVQSFMCKCDLHITNATMEAEYKSRMEAMARLICLNINYLLTI